MAVLGSMWWDIRVPIHLIGFSEGACTVIRYLYDAACSPWRLTPYERTAMHRVKSVTVIEAPLWPVVQGFGAWMCGTVWRNYNSSMRLLNVWNRASIAQGRNLPGWGNSKSYDSRPLWVQLAHYAYPPYSQMLETLTRVRFSPYHNNPLHNGQPLGWIIKNMRGW